MALGRSLSAFVKMIEKVSFEEQKSHKKFLKIKHNVEIKIDNTISRVSPFDNTLITTNVNYHHNVIVKQ